ncbi:hypothetical protein VME0621_01580 [Vibrio mediterranei]|uniref:hypothetical protein n=1 Tax=Vibrio mediterranei TaxID=689 RepID=UPI000781DB61|nr:hypothetical protein [Vibrio mediterranei]SBO09481.1 hypothetical protein VME0621_01580 [Vibrio mediterranei]
MSGLAPLPTGSSRNKIEFLYEQMAGLGGGSTLPIIKTNFFPSEDTGWNDDLDGFVLKPFVPTFANGWSNDLDLKPFITPELEHDEPLVTLCFSVSLSAMLSGFTGELAYTILLVNERGEPIRDGLNTPIGIGLNSTTMHGAMSEQGQRVTANETVVLSVDKLNVHDKEKVIARVVVRADPTYQMTQSVSHRDVLEHAQFQVGEVTLVGLGVSSTSI